MALKLTSEQPTKYVGEEAAKEILSKIKTAQSTADAASTAASEAQSTANEAKETAEEALAKAGTGASGDYLPLAGGTMTGDIVMRGLPEYERGVVIKPLGIESYESSGYDHEFSITITGDESEGSSFPHSNQTPANKGTIMLLATGGKGGDNNYGADGIVEIKAVGGNGGTTESQEQLPKGSGIINLTADAINLTGEVTFSDTMYGTEDIGEGATLTTGKMYLVYED